MAKVFVAFYNGVKGTNDLKALLSFFEAFLNSLKKYGNEVFSVVHGSFNNDWNGIPDKLLTKIKNFNPDLIILFNNNFYDLSKEFDCPIAVYEVDSPLYYCNKEKIKNNPSRYKFLTCGSSSEKILLEEFNVPKENILLVPFCTAIEAQDIPKERNICFIGTKFARAVKNDINIFMELNPNDEERKQFLRLVELVQENPYILEDELLSRIQSEKIKSTFVKHHIISLLSDYRRMKILSNVADLGIDIWGTPSWATDLYNDPWLMLNYHKEIVYSIKHNQDIYNSSKIGINVGHFQAKNCFPFRIFDIMASNACLVSEFHKDFDLYFPELKLPYYSNAWEARQICKKLLDDESYRLDLVAQSQEIVNNNYRFKHTLALVEDFLGVNLGVRQNIDESSKFLDLQVLSDYLPKPIKKIKKQEFLLLKIIKVILMKIRVSFLI